MKSRFVGSDSEIKELSGFLRAKNPPCSYVVEEGESEKAL
jgi:hypothetical protein